MIFELVRIADVDLTVLMRDGKDGSEHMYTYALPRPVAHLFLDLWLVLSIFCWMLICNIQSHQMLPFEAHMLCLNALRIFSEFLFVLNASCALLMMLRWLLMICYVVSSRWLGLSMTAQGNNGFWPVAN